MILAQPGMLRNFGCSDRLGNMRQYIVLCFFDMGIPRVVFFASRTFLQSSRAVSSMIGGISEGFLERSSRCKKE